MSIEDKKKLADEEKLEDAKKGLKSAVEEILFKDVYPNKAKVEARRADIEPLVEELVFSSIRMVVQELCLMGYTEELATLSALNIVSKVVVFEGLFLLRQDIGHWFPEGFETLEPEEKASVSIGIIQTLFRYMKPAIGAYVLDEQLDKAIPHADKLGGYHDTTVGIFIENAREVFEDISSEKKELQFYRDPSKWRLGELVKFYFEIFRMFENNDLQDNPKELLKHLKNESLDGFYQQYQFIGLLAQAWLSEDNNCSDEEIAEVIQLALLPLADVTNYEGLSAWIAMLMHGEKPDPYRKIPLPLPFADAIYMERGIIGSDLFMHDAFHAYYLSLVESQGLVMVANALYLRRGYALEITPDKMGVRFVKRKDYKQLSLKDLLSKHNQNLRDYIKVLQFLVRLSDDFGDVNGDMKSKSANLLLLMEEFRHHFVGGKKKGKKEDDDDMATTKPLTLEVIMELERRMAEEDGRKFDPEAVRQGLIEAEEGYLGGLGKRTGLDLSGLMNEMYDAYDAGQLSPDNAPQWIARMIKMLDQAKYNVMNQIDNGVPKDIHCGEKSYEEYVTDLYEIARGAILIGTKINDEAFTQDALS